MPLYDDDEEERIRLVAAKAEKLRKKNAAAAAAASAPSILSTAATQLLQKASAAVSTATSMAKDTVTALAVAKHGPAPAQQQIFVPAPSPPATVTLFGTTTTTATHQPRQCTWIWSICVAVAAVCLLGNTPFQTVPPAPFTRSIRDGGHGLKWEPDVIIHRENLKISEDSLRIDSTDPDCSNPVHITVVFVSDYAEDSLASFGDFPQTVAEQIALTPRNTTLGYCAPIVRMLVVDHGWHPSSGTKPHDFAVNVFHALSAKRAGKRDLIHSNVHYIWVGKGFGSVLIQHIFVHAHWLQSQCTEQGCAINTDAPQGKIVAERSRHFISLSGAFAGYEWTSLMNSGAIPNWFRGWIIWNIPSQYNFNELTQEKLELSTSEEKMLAANLDKFGTKLSCYAATQAPPLPTFVGFEWSVTDYLFSASTVRSTMKKPVVSQASAWKLCDSAPKMAFKDTVDTRHESIGIPRAFESQVFQAVYSVIENLNYQTRTLVIADAYDSYIDSLKRISSTIRSEISKSHPGAPTVGSSFVEMFTNPAVLANLPRIIAAASATVATPASAPVTAPSVTLSIAPSSSESSDSK